MWIFLKSLQWVPIFLPLWTMLVYTGSLWCALYFPLQSHLLPFTLSPHFMHILMHTLCTLCASLGTLSYLLTMAFLFTLLLGLCLTLFSLKTQLRAFFSWRRPSPSALYPPEGIRWPSYIVPEHPLFLLWEHLPFFIATIYLLVCPPLVCKFLKSRNQLFVFASLEPGSPWDAEWRLVNSCQWLLFSSSD